MTESTTASTLPTLRYMLGSTVTPGDRLGTLRQVLPGPGTYVKGGHIYASATGKLQVDESATNNDNANNNNLGTARVQTHKELASMQVLKVGDVVLARVVRITTQQAALEIVAMQGGNQKQCQYQYHHDGVIRREDVRAGASTTISTEQGVQLEASFLPGDLVLCRVLSLGDARRYYLTTAEPELGVIHAVSVKSGMPMVPCSWKEMECPETGAKELRKCARPRELTLNVE